MELDAIRVALDSNNLTEASRLFEEVPDAELGPEERFQLGRLYLKTGKGGQAGEQFVIASLRGQWTLARLANVVDLLLSYNLKPAAAAVIGASVVRFPNEPILVAAFARVCAEVGDVPLALTLFEKVDPALLEKTPVQLRLFGQILVKGGRIGEGRLMLDRYFELFPDKIEVTSVLSNDELDAALASEADWGWAYFHRGKRALETFEYDVAINRLTGAVAHLTGSPRSLALEGLAEAIRRFCSTQDAIDQLKALSREFPEESALALYAGTIEYRSGNMIEAAELFTRVPEGFADRHVVARGAKSFVRPVHEAQNVVPQIVDLELASITPEDKAVLFCAADNRYFRLFHASVLASILHVCGDTPVHFHIVNPDASTLEILNRIRKQVGSRIGWSSEQCSFAFPRPYYAMARFLVAPYLLDAYGLPLIISDIDAVLIKDPIAGLASVGPFDVGIKKHASRRLEFPWTEVFATFAIFAPTRGSVSFLNSVSTYFWNVHNRQPTANLWWIDQNALTFAAECHSGSSSVAVIDIGETRLDRCIETNERMASKEEFIRRVISRYKSPEFPL